MGRLHATIDVSAEVTLEKTKSEWRLSTAFCSVRHVWLARAVNTRARARTHTHTAAEDLQRVAPISV